MAAAVRGEEHWTVRDGDVRLFLFVHGSSMASQPTFDLQVPGRPDNSAMEHFAARGF